MRLISKIDKHEMLRRWAISEVYVKYRHAMHEIPPQHLLGLLYSKDVNLEKEGISNSLALHHFSLVDCLPVNASWYLAGMELSSKEFNKLKTLGVESFFKMTNGSYQVADAALALEKNQYQDLRIKAIKKALETGINEVEWLGITLLASDVNGPFTIVEGNGRLISLYQHLFLNKDERLLNHQLEVVLGISDEELKIYFKYLD